LPGEKEKKEKRSWVLPAIGAILLAAVTAFASGLGAQVGGSIGSDEPPLVTYSTELLSTRCRGGEFVPQTSLSTVLDSSSSSNWEALEDQPGAAQASFSPVQVAIQGGSGRVITLTRIEFDITRRSRPQGAVFIGACGGPVEGRSLQVDLDRHPPRVVDSNATKEGMLGSRDANGKRLDPPIRFPWSVSVQDPLLLEIIATTASCDCTWTAEIFWVSGGSSGTIAIDNDGEGYRVVGTNGLPSYSPDSLGWRRFRA
jgi:hypothetical protein